MEFTVPPVDLDALRAYRLGRLVEQIREAGLGGMLLIDPINTRYATDSTNMQIWSMHDETRCVFIGPDGAVVLFDYDHLPHLLEDLPFITEVKVMPVFYYFAAGATRLKRPAVLVARSPRSWRDMATRNYPLAVDRLSLLGTDALRDRGLRLVDAWPLVEQARCIKSPEEIVLLRNAIAVAEAGCAAMREVLAPGITENAPLGQAARGQHSPGRRMDRDPPAFLRAAHQSLVPRMLDAGDRAGRPWSASTPISSAPTVIARISRAAGSAATSHRPEAQRTQYKQAHAQLRAEHCDPEAGHELPRCGGGQLAHSRAIPAHTAIPAWPHGVGLADEYPSLPYREITIAPMP